jgi:hypothetical protein
MQAEQNNPAMQAGRSAGPVKWYGALGWLQQESWAVTLAHTTAALPEQCKGSAAAEDVPPNRFAVATQHMLSYTCRGYCTASHCKVAKLW